MAIGDRKLKTEVLRKMANSTGWPRGISRALPITLGYVPIGFAFGVLANKAGISTFNTLAMSVFVYAGSSQLIAVGLFASGTAPLSIILTTFIVNLRHMLMSSALAPYLKSWSRLQLIAFSYEITDESFALHSVEFPRTAPLGGPYPGESLALNMTAQISWILGTWLGLVAGGLITDIETFALDYALPAMFIASYRTPAPSVPSPTKATAIPSSSRRRLAIAIPAATGTMPP